ncbi:MAG: aspartate/glutamate racemase family protein [Lysobacterales bacterium]|jgi:glutamate racemase
MATPVFFADTCVGGLSVLKSLWGAGMAGNAVFMADYVVNPLGIKSDAEIADVVQRWMGFAEEHAETLVIACNTLSIRYHELHRQTVPETGLGQVVSMVDCFKAMVRAEAGRLAGRKVLVIGTEFTATQDMYPALIKAGAPGAQVSTFGATELERRIARFEPLDGGGESVFDGDLQAAIAGVDFAVLACTCFPMVSSRLANLFPGVTFLDPGSYCADLLPRSNDTGDRKLRIEVTGSVVEQARVTKFAQTYLGHGSEILP